jgi:hypothetical protein
MVDVLIEVWAFLFGWVLRNPFSGSRGSNPDVFSRAEPMFTLTFLLLILDDLFLGLRGIHALS